MHPEDALREELTLLRAAMARRLRQKLEADGDVSPALMEAARKFLADQGMTLSKVQAPRAPAVTEDPPFPGTGDDA